jgi:UDP:flavonoid glycosyltransferase YjiC (YdhE family)
MSQKKTILIIVPPMSGHFNPMISIASELSKKDDVSIIVFGTPKFKNQIEKSNCEYVEYADLEYEVNLNNTAPGHTIFDTVMRMIKGGHAIMPQIISLCEQRKPDAIM